MKPLRLVIALLPLAALVLWLAFGAGSEEGFVVDCSPNTILRGNFPLITEHWDEPQLHQLRSREDFASITAGDTTGLFLKLCHWVHGQWERSIPDPYPRANALEILKEIRAGRTGGFCGQYAYVLADVLKSLGFFCVRYVELWGLRRESHFVVEAWNSELGKWMILDPDQDLAYFRADGIPANAMEVRSGLFGKQVVSARSAAPGHSSLGRRFMKYYAHFAVSLRSDLMRSPRPPTVKDRFRDFLFFQDDRTDLSTFQGGIPYSLVTRRVEDLYFDCNSLRMEWERVPQRRALRFRFFTDGSTPNFMAFQLKPGASADWITLGNDEMLVDITDLPLSFEAAPVNRAGRRGRVSRVVVHRP